MLFPIILYAVEIWTLTFVHKEASLMWLRRSVLKGSTESLIIAPQDQPLYTRYHQRAMQTQQINSSCFLCDEAEKHISHFIAGCKVLAASEYTHQHNKELLISAGIYVETWE